MEIQTRKKSEKGTEMWKKLQFELSLFNLPASSESFNARFFFGKTEKAKSERETKERIMK